MAKNKFGEIVPYHPQGQHWQDGSIVADLPTNRLSELFNINQFIVSQVRNAVCSHSVFRCIAKRRLYCRLLLKRAQHACHTVQQAS